MKWVVGVDLRPGCYGALGFARFLAERVGDTATAVHAVQLPDLLDQPPSQAEVRDHVERFVQERLDKAGVQVAHDVDPDEALHAAVTEQGADGIIIGRRSPADGDEVVRLGAVARRILRHLGHPVLVCPADLKADAVADGPVMLAAVPAEQCVGALRFAQGLARRLGRPLEVVAAVRPAFGSSVSYLPAPAYQGSLFERAQAELTAWLDAHGAGDCSATVVEGTTVPVILGEADARQAVAIVCGSRRLSVVDRIFQSSIGGVLAGTARVPVAVVPPEA